MDLALVDSGVDVDENKYVPSCAGGVGADGSTVDDGGLATITNGDIVTGGLIVDTGEDALVDDVDGASPNCVNLPKGTNPLLKKFLNRGSPHGSNWGQEPQRSKISLLVPTPLKVPKTHHLG